MLASDGGIKRALLGHVGYGNQPKPPVSVLFVEKLLKPGMFGGVANSPADIAAELKKLVRDVTSDEPVHTGHEDG